MQLAPSSYALYIPPLPAPGTLDPSCAKFYPLGDTSLTTAGLLGLADATFTRPEAESREDLGQNEGAFKRIGNMRTLTKKYMCFVFRYFFVLILKKLFV